MKRATVLVAVAPICAALLAAHAAASVAPVHGRSAYYVCEGSGKPTVVLEAGSPDDSSVWRAVQASVARFTRVCAYDRAGLGRSEPAAASGRTALTQVGDLHALLSAARIRGPYVIVGHSWGGALAQLFATRYVRETAGVVLLDPFYFTPAMVSHLRPGFGPGPVTKVEHVDLLGSIKQLQAIRSFGSLPLVLVTHGTPSLNSDALTFDRAVVARSSNGVLVTARASTHMIPLAPPKGQPAVVVAAIRGVVQATRRGRRLPGCRSLFPGLDVGCR
jgi:pimeloyl-ACP methyl ester carboxylesterase